MSSPSADRVRFWLEEFQPARKVSLVGEPLSRIRLVALGDAADVALLARVEEFVGTPLRVEVLD